MTDGPSGPSTTSPGTADLTTSATNTDDPTVSATDTDGPTATAGVECGNGEVDGDEACDDGVNDGAYGGCNDDCTLAAYCGDGEVQAAEDCDDGDDVQGNGCNIDCLLSGQELWTHLFVTAQDDRLDSPYFSEGGDVVVRAQNPSVEEVRILAALDGEVLSNIPLPPGTMSVRPWGEGDSFLALERAGTPTIVGDLSLVRYSSTGVEQWRQVYESETSAHLSVRPGEWVAIASFETASLTANEGTRRIRVVSGNGSTVWSDATEIGGAALAYDDIVSLSSGNTVASLNATFSTPYILRGYNSGGGPIWEVEPNGAGSAVIEPAADGGFVSLEGNWLRVRNPSGSLVVEQDVSALGFDPTHVASASNGDFLLAGSQSGSQQLVRISSQLEVLWERDVLADRVPFAEVTGLVVGPDQHVAVSLDVYVSDAQENDGWCILFSP